MVGMIQMRHGIDFSVSLFKSKQPDGLILHPSSHADYKGNAGDFTHN